MRDVLMVAVMIATILLLAAYVALCDRIIGSAEPEATDAGAAGTRREHEPVGR